MDEIFFENILKTESRLTRSPVVIWVIVAFFFIFVIWARFFELNQVVRVSGIVVSEGRSQIIQVVDGGVLREIYVKEGDYVTAGTILASLDDTRFTASTNEILARVNALSARTARLRGELTDSAPEFPQELLQFEELLQTETAIFERRQKSLMDKKKAMQLGLKLALVEKDMVDELVQQGDFDSTEQLRIERAVIDAQAGLNEVINNYYETVSEELSVAEDELAQNSEILTQRLELLRNTKLRSNVNGYIKNISVTTLGAVLQPGQELMQVTPSEDSLLVEVKIPPRDIADIVIDQVADLRFDAYDSSIFGALSGAVSFVSADTLSEKSSSGIDEYYYMAYISLPSDTHLTSIGKSIDLISGMTVQADIQTGSRNVLTYLLKPVIKTLGESFGER